MNDNLGRHGSCPPRAYDVEGDTGKEPVIPYNAELVKFTVQWEQRQGGNQSEHSRREVPGVNDISMGTYRIDRGHRCEVWIQLGQSVPDRMNNFIMNDMELGEPRKLLSSVRKREMGWDSKG